MLHDGHILLVGKVIVGPVEKMRLMNIERVRKIWYKRLKIYGELQNNMVSKLNPQITIPNLLLMPQQPVSFSVTAVNVLQCR